MIPGGSSSFLQGVLALELPVPLLEPVIGLTHQFFHGTALVVAGNVVVKIAPHTFDAIVIGTVRREEVQHDAAVQPRECRFGLNTAVDAVVVEDQVDPLGRWVVAADKLPQLEDEQLAVLAVRLDPRQPAGPRVQRPGQVPFVVLAEAEGSGKAPR